MICEECPINNPYESDCYDRCVPCKYGSVDFDCTSCNECNTKKCQFEPKEDDV